MLGSIFWAALRRWPHSQLARVLGRLNLRMRGDAAFAGTPEDQQVRSAICTVDGWYASREDVDEIQLQLNGAPLPYVRLERADIAHVFGERHCVAFRAYFEVTGGAARLEVNGRGVELHVTDTALEQSRTATTARTAKRDWILQHVSAPPRAVDAGPLDYLPEEWKREFRIDDPTAI